MSCTRSGELDDFDLDGVVNLLEFALGLNPLAFDANLLPFVVSDGDQLTLTYPRNTLLTGLTFEVQRSTDLLNWIPVPDSLLSTTNFVELRKASLAIPPDPRHFLRLAVSH